MVALTTQAQILGEDDIKPTPMTIESGLRYCEGTTPYRNQILVSNFGSAELNPFNQEGKGYIVSINTDGRMKSFIPADGHLSAPKGMVVAQGHLYIADVGRLVVYDLSDLDKRPQIVLFPAEDTYLNDVIQMGDMILVSVTNTGRIYGIDIVKPLEGQTPSLLGNVPGANGMVINGTMIYIASYNPNETPTPENVIYAYDIAAPKGSISKLIPGLGAGQYDGIALSEDGSTLYFTSWGNGKADSSPAVFKYQLDGKDGVKILDFGIDMKGPADISLKNGYIWIPDLPQSKLYRLPL